MKIYAVVSTSPSWMNGGYGVSLLAAEHRDLLVPFEEFSKRPSQQLRPEGMPTPATYTPRVGTENLEAAFAALAASDRIRED